MAVLGFEEDSYYVQNGVKASEVTITGSLLLGT